MRIDFRVFAVFVLALPSLAQSEPPDATARTRMVAEGESPNRVDLVLTTHTAGGFTFKDIALAQSIDEIATRCELTCAIDGSGQCWGCQ